MKIWVLLFIAAGMVSLGSCGADVKKMNEEVDKAAAELNGSLVHARESVVRLDSFVENLFLNISNYDLSTDKMDADKGGNYKYFENLMYYKYTNDGYAASIASGYVPISDIIKKRMKLYELAGPLMKSLINNNFSDMLIMDHNYDILFAYPWVDFISITQPKLHVANFPWVTLAFPANDPGKSFVWLKEPFVALGGTGWLVVCISPVYNGNKLEAVISEDVYPAAGARVLFGQSKTMLLLITDKGFVIAASLVAKDTLNIKVLKEFDYLKQMQKNEFLPEEYQLSYKNNSREIRDFGERLKTADRFNMKINGINYFVYKKSLEELTNLAIVGLVEK